MTSGLVLKYRKGLRFVIQAGYKAALPGSSLFLLTKPMDKLGMEVVEVDLRDAYAFGGGLHCCTADVYREGSCEDYFPHLS